MPMRQFQMHSGGHARGFPRSAAIAGARHGRMPAMTQQAYFFRTAVFFAGEVFAATSSTMNVTFMLTR